ncbi:ATP-dependent protease [Raphidocelis subcapitata]|uniref:ATP-dependent protease n=1 Tax=Raphidocelis subcapitata TaxID=307507 RepID=A0A2V0PHN5_9CHLO|nr:ATP-dependent protease [Raphidocelis subcapitata]|eukprot:GBF97423.1 ATP-dependent protease [Raphidocelis subcapitata]
MALSAASGAASNACRRGQPAVQRWRAGAPRRAPRLQPCAAGGGGARTVRELPIFPLGMVALPHATVPLMIFEPRYRVLFNTLMDGAPDIEEGLVQKDSPYAGTRVFGMCYVDGSSGRMATVGTALEIQAHTFEADGRILVVNKGLERFRVTKVVKERPVLICEVETLPDDEDETPEAKAAATEVAEMFRNVLRLYRKMRRSGRGGVSGGAGAPAGAGGSSEPEEEPEEPEELTEFSPTQVHPPPQLSYWIASVLGEHRGTQQALLEEDSTRGRLAREAEVLGQTLKFYSAATALESVFTSDGGAQPPAGGPD